jgi:hypothetical protein
MMKRDDPNRRAVAMMLRAVRTIARTDLDGVPADSPEADLVRRMRRILAEYWDKRQ